MAAGRLRGRVDFERALSTAPVSRSAHFALHHVKPKSACLSPAPAGAVAQGLSTGSSTALPPAVDDCLVEALFGCLVPKRHARRAVSRSLLKRQMRAVAQEAALTPGLWLVRLRSPFAASRFVSAASPALAQAARAELLQLFKPWRTA